MYNTQLNKISIVKLDVTDSACRRIAELINAASESKAALRVSVDGGGCSGFMYHYELVSETSEEDAVIEKNGVKVVVDPLSQQFLEGCSVDFVEELGASFFQVINPNASAKCGCGSSFSI